MAGWCQGTVKAWRSSRQLRRVISGKVQNIAPHPHGGMFQNTISAGIVGPGVTTFTHTGLSPNMQ